MYIAMNKGGTCSVWLGIIHIYQQQQFLIPLVDLVSDILVNQLLGAKSGAQMWSGLCFDVDISVRANSGAQIRSALCCDIDISVRGLLLWPGGGLWL